MTAYLDASVLVSAFQQDVHSDRVDAWFDTGPDFLLSSWAIAEVSSALSLQVRMKRLADRERRAVELHLDGWLAQRALIHPQAEDFQHARSLLRQDVRLRTPDALHLAITARLDLDLITLDQEMADAAHDAGLRTLLL